MTIEIDLTPCRNPPNSARGAKWQRSATPTGARKSEKAISDDDVDLVDLAALSVTTEDGGNAMQTKSVGRKVGRHSQKGLEQEPIAVGRHSQQGLEQSSVVSFGKRLNTIPREALGPQTSAMSVKPDFGALRFGGPLPGSTLGQPLPTLPTQSAPVLFSAALPKTGSSSPRPDQAVSDAQGTAQTRTSSTSAARIFGTGTTSQFQNSPRGIAAGHSSVSMQPASFPPQTTVQSKGSITMQPASAFTSYPSQGTMQYGTSRSEQPTSYPPFNPQQSSGSSTLQPRSRGLTHENASKPVPVPKSLPEKPRVVEGWLLKSGRFRWQDRWCRLDGTVLQYYRDADCAELRAEINLTSLSRIAAFTSPDASEEAQKQKEKHPFGFEVATGGEKILNFDASTEAKLTAWLRTLWGAVTYAKALEQAKGIKPDPPRGSKKSVTMPKPQSYIVGVPFVADEERRPSHPGPSANFGQSIGYLEPASGFAAPPSGFGLTPRLSNPSLPVSGYGGYPCYNTSAQGAPTSYAACSPRFGGSSSQRWQTEQTVNALANMGNRSQGWPTSQGSVTLGSASISRQGSRHGSAQFGYDGTEKRNSRKVSQPGSSFAFLFK